MSEGDSVGNGNSNGAAAKVPQWTDEDDKALHEAARYLSTAHLSFIAISIYLALAIWQTTHQQLLLGASFTLPVLNVSIDLVTFYTLGPWLYVLLHATLLTQLRLFARSVFRWGLARQKNRDTELPLGLSPLLYYLLLQRMALSRLMLATAVGTTLLIGPLLLVWLFQVRFLAYHDGTVTMWQRGAVFADGALLLLMWPQVVSRRIALGVTRGSSRGRLRRFLRAWLCGFHDERIGCVEQSKTLDRARRRTLRTLMLSIVLPMPLLLGLSWLFRDAGDADGLLLSYAACCLAGLALAYWQVRRPAGGINNEDVQPRSPFVLSYAAIIGPAAVCSLSLFTLVPTIAPDACIRSSDQPRCRWLAVASGASWLEPVLLHSLAAISGYRLLLPGQIDELNHVLLDPPDGDSAEALRWRPGWCAWLDRPEKSNPQNDHKAESSPPPPPRRCGRLGPVALPTALLFEPDLQRGNAGDTRRRLLPSRYLHLRGAALDMDIKPEDVALEKKADGAPLTCDRDARRDNEPTDPGEKRVWQYARALRVQFRDLAGADLRDASLPLGQFQTVNLYGAMLDGAYLNGARLYGIDLRYASLTWSHLDNSDWDGVQADFSALDHADLRCARILRTDLVGARMIDVETARLHLEHSDLRGALIVSQPPRPDSDPQPAPENRSVLAGLTATRGSAAELLKERALRRCPPGASSVQSVPAKLPSPPPLFGIDDTQGPAAAGRQAAQMTCTLQEVQPEDFREPPPRRLPTRYANALVLMAPPFAAQGFEQSTEWLEAVNQVFTQQPVCPAAEDALLRARLAFALQPKATPAAPTAAQRCEPRPAD